MIAWKAHPHDTHAFPLEAPPLLVHGPVVAPLGDAQAGIHHSVPGQPAATRQIRQGAAYQAGVAGHSGQFGDLTVGSHLAARDCGHHLPDPFLRGQRFAVGRGGLT
jgi:hypothetical protein